MLQWLQNFRLDGSHSVHNRQLFDDVMYRIEDRLEQDTGAE